MNLSIEHVLLLLTFIFLFYHPLGNCGCIEGIRGNPCIESCSGALCTTYPKCLEISALDLDPSPGSHAFSYEYIGNVQWRVNGVILSGESPDIMILLNQLYVNFRIFKISVKDISAWWREYDYEITVEIAPSKKRWDSDSLKLRFFDESEDYYDLLISRAGTHSVKYNSKKPKLTGVRNLDER